MHWDEEFIKLLDFYTPVNLWERYKKKQVAESERLYLDLGLSPERIQALVYAFNDIIERYRGNNNIYITVNQLGQSHTFGDLLNLFKNAIDKA